MRRRRPEREGQEKRERENRRPVLRKLYAALLRPSRGQHSEKMKRSEWGNWEPREFKQPFRPNSNGVGDQPRQYFAFDNLEQFVSSLQLES